MITLNPSSDSTRALAEKLPWLTPALSGEWAAKAGTTLTPIGDGIGVKLVEYATQDPENGRFENHRDHVDVQVSLEGGEIIDITPTAPLSPSTDYDPAEDLTFYHPPKGQLVTIPFSKGNILVLYPDDAHRCATRDTIHPRVRKLVFKVHSSIWRKS